MRGVAETDSSRVGSFRLLNSNIPDMTAKLNTFSQHTEGAIAAAQGAAAPVPFHEVKTLTPTSG